MSFDSVHQVDQSFPMYQIPLVTTARLWNRCLSLDAKFWVSRKATLLCCFSSFQCNDGCIYLKSPGICMLCVLANLADLMLHVRQVSSCCLGEVLCVFSLQNSASNWRVLAVVCPLLGLIYSLLNLFLPTIEGCWVILVSQWITTF